MAYVIEQLYRDRINEDTSSYATTQEWSLRSDDPMVIDEVYYAFTSELTDNRQVYSNSDTRKLKRFELECEEDSGGKYWIARLEWSGGGGETSGEYPEQIPTALPETFSTEGGTAHITEAIDEAIYPCTGKTLTSNFNKIGWNGETNVGCDVVRPDFTFTLEKEFDYAEVTAGVKTAWAEATGKVNSEQFRGFAAGCVLFMGVSGASNVTYDGTLINVYIGDDDNGDPIYQTQKKATVKYKCTFKFRCAPATIFSISGANAPKNGFQYAWVLNELVDTNDGKTRDEPVGVIVNTVYYSTDLNNIVN